MLIGFDSEIRPVLEYAEPVSQKNDYFDGIGLECPGVEEYLNWCDTHSDGTIGSIIEAVKTVPSSVVCWFFSEAMIREPIRVFHSPEVVAEYFRVCLNDTDARRKFAVVFTAGLPSDVEAAVNAHIPPQSIEAWRNDPEIAPLIGEL